MTLTSLTPDIAWIVPWNKLQQLCHLWRESGITTNSAECIYLNGDQLLDAGFSVDYEVFQLLVESDFTALLWGKPHLNGTVAEEPPLDQYEIFISFAPAETSKVLEALQQCQGFFPQLDVLRAQTLPIHSHVPHPMMLALLDLGRSPQVQDLLLTEEKAPNQPLNILLNQRLEQERILNSVTHRIYQNQDVMVIVRMALEQVQQLLRVDRLLVYQLDVSAELPDERVNRVTFEVLSSNNIPSLLAQEEHLAPDIQQGIREYYQLGNPLTISDTTQAPTTIALSLPMLPESAQPRASLTIPLLVENRLWGLLIAHQCETPRRWRKNEMAFLSHVAEYLAIAILQARSYQQLQEQKNSLETLAKQRAKELEDALLSAQVASQSKKEFIHIMSHELLTPLTSIIGLSNTLSYWSSAENATKLSPDKQQHYLKTIHESGLKLRNLLQDILDFSQTEAARSFLDLQQFSLKKLSYMVVNSFQEMSHRQGLTLKFVNRLEPEDELFYADPIRLEKILTHLLSNAIKFTSHGGEVTFTLWRENSSDVLFQIKDTGIGIPPQQLPLLFEKFQQLEPSISRSHDGAGFGLALVKQLVEIHQGQIHVTSMPKRGSTFTVRIPCQTKAKDRPSEHNSAVKNPGGTIVLVSQDEEIATLICDLLTATNYQVIWLIDGTIAIDQITVLQPMLVILDAQQDETQVEEMIEDLQGTPQTQKIPALLLSNRLSPPLWRQLHKRGFQDYIQKPIQCENLIELVNYYVTRYDAPQNVATDEQAIA